MALEGHEVASRGLTGKIFPLAPNNAIMTQVREASNILHNITGKHTYLLHFFFFFPLSFSLLSVFFFFFLHLIF